MFSFSLRKHPFLLALRRWDVSRGGTSVTQRQKIHTDDPNQCLQNSPVVMGFQIQIYSVFMCLLVDFGKVLCSSPNELHITQTLLLEKSIFHKY